MISIVIPTYNERENLEELITLIDKNLDNYRYEIIIVDDDSPDRTWELAQELSKRYPVKVIRRINERGLATAVIEGFKHASGNILLVMDADLQHPPEKIPELLKPILEESVDLVIASRYVDGGGVKEWSFPRKMISKGAIFLSHLALPKLRNIKDPMSGYFAVKKEVIEGVELKPIGYKILLEILIKGKIRKVKEIPYVFGEREKGESKLGKKQIIDYIKHLWVLSLWTGEFWRIFKYVMVGVTGMMVNLGLLYFLVESNTMENFLRTPIIYQFLININVEVTKKLVQFTSGVISVETSVIWNYIWNNLWTFKERKIRGKKGLLKGLIKFNTVSIGGIVINLIVYYIFITIFNIYYIYAEIIAIFTAFTWNFIMNDIWTWGNREKN